MKFILFCEGPTERMGLPEFLKRWLDPQLSHRVGIRPVEFQGWGDLYREAKKKAHLRLKEDDVVAVISLLDLYGPTFYPEDKVTADERYQFGKAHIEQIVGHERFKQFFAVHEVEAWLLSDPTLFPRDVRAGFPSSVSNPETVNFNVPPAKLLDRLYREKMRRTYRKRTLGPSLFSRLDPDTARARCPKLANMLDVMLDLALQAGL